MARRSLVAFMAAALLALPVFLSLGAAGDPSGSFEERVSIEYFGSNHAGPGPHPTTESDRFLLTRGGIRWPVGGTVEYLVAGAPAGAPQAVDQAVATLDVSITTRGFAHNESTTQINPCTGQPNSISWRTGDGPGGVLAQALVCFNSSTKEIAGFRIAFDSTDPWTTTGAPNAFDVENVATHEFGHVAGLDEVSGPRDGCLTMYKFSGLGETQKRTLGLGDKLGLNKLYQTGDTSAGPGCGQ